ncbi:MAG: hypothetical protein HY294_09845 [Candidatus Rokubacteria bacterium]|nr:hypothetical protein [Candidatus Rokubacteria bacterium]MBI3826287.1 hypothetical protein [Candidatus Rokubacteria bacterium]
MRNGKFDRSAQDLGNIINLEHLNVRVPDQQIATAFYVVGMGFTRDPYLMVGLENMWINIGLTQIHMPTGNAQAFPGHSDVVLPDLEALKTRLASVKERLAGTKFSCVDEGKTVMVTCPWGNRYRCHAPGPEYRDWTLGIVNVDFPVARGHAEGIARFYREVLDAPAGVVDDGEGRAARVVAGNVQTLTFRESDQLTPYDGHHIAIYISDFSGPHRKMVERGIVSEESNDYQYRFKDIVDLDSGTVLFTVEHEVRSMTHPMVGRPFVNRNPAQQQRTYQRGRDAFV